MSTVVEEKKATTRTARFGLRATPQQQRLIQRAAEVLNKNVTEFVLDSACKFAENTLLDQRLFLANDEDWQKFQDALEQPAEVKPGLQKLMKEKSPWE